ncbi:MAG: GGDEF domain-containing protein [Acidobacteria bacterium]|nr:MAG: GGDEF domain-containing protein [Acidobacteriota bacterium]REK00141.1 MAG: GGDEF domain-containing protein [Acidobacteriota bacterium]
MSSETTTRITRVAATDPAVVEQASVVLIYGNQLGRRFSIDPELSVGRALSNSIVLDDDSVSRQHALFYRRGDGFFVSDLGSTNGTLVNDFPVESETPLRNGDLVTIGGVVFKFISDNTEAQYFEEIYRLTIIDGLTQMHNRRYLFEFLEREVLRCSRSGSDLGLVLVDIDNFKAINDTHGHLFGDRVLKEIAKLIRDVVRKEQVLARYGGDEFAAVLTDTDPEGCRMFAEKVRRRVEDHPFRSSDGLAVETTLSIGLASLDGPCTHEQFFERADAALYRAKQAGRNRVAV